MKKLIFYLIRMYKKYISPIFHFIGVDCKYYPTCSDYMVEAIEEFGVIKGCLKGIKRILKCNPFSKGGYDPVKK